MLLEGKAAVVTGCSGGLGSAIAAALSDQGATIVAMDLTAEKVEQACEAVRARGARAVHGIVMDVACARSVAEAFAAAKQTIGKLDILVNNAGVREIKNAFDLSPEEWDRVIAINLSGPFYCAREAALWMRDTGGGTIINIASVAGLTAISHRPAYTAAKHGVVGLTKNLARDFAGAKIRVNAVAPGVLRTPMTQDYYADPEFLRGLKHSVPFHDRGEAADIGRAVLFLASPLAEFINGVTLPVDGGWLAEKSYASPEAASFFSAGSST
jgi:NAD(P)-dependent dehydrogenase (short-subunit alcohol dehydrogenase family)